MFAFWFAVRNESSSSLCADTGESASAPPPPLGGNWRFAEDDESACERPDGGGAARTGGMGKCVGGLGNAESERTEPVFGSTNGGRGGSMSPCGAVRAAGSGGAAVACGCQATVGEGALRFSPRRSCELAEADGGPVEYPGGAFARASSSSRVSGVRCALPADCGWPPASSWIGFSPPLAGSSSLGWPPSMLGRSAGRVPVQPPSHSAFHWPRGPTVGENRRTHSQDFCHSESASRERLAATPYIVE